MVDTFTPNFNLTKPEVGASRDAWGTKWNANADVLDTAVKAVSDKVNNFVSGASSFCELAYAGNNVLRLLPRDGNTVLIDGRPRVIPPFLDFNTLTGVGVAASSNNYLVAYWDTTTDPVNPKVALRAVQGARTRHSTLGYATVNNDDTVALVGGFYAQANRSVIYSDSQKHMATWYNPVDRALFGAFGEGAISSQTYVEVNSAVPISAYMWGDRAIYARGRSDVFEITFENAYFAVSMDYSLDGDRFYDNVVTLPQSYGAPANPNGPMQPRTDGLHTITALGRTPSGVRVNYSHTQVTALVNM